MSGTMHDLYEYACPCGDEWVETDGPVSVCPTCAARRRALDTEPGDSGA